MSEGEVVGVSTDEKGDGRRLYLLLNYKLLRPPAPPSPLITFSASKHQFSVLPPRVSFVDKKNRIPPGTKDFPSGTTFMFFREVNFPFF